MKKEKFNLKMLKVKNNPGITLIALVISIIVLLILAGVSIATLTGENGILTQAQNAKTETEKAKAKEQIELCATESVIAGSGSVNKATLKDSLVREGATIETADGEISTLPVIVKLDEKEYGITGSGEVLNVESNITNVSTEFVKENVIVKDTEGSFFVLPAGYKVLTSEATKVTEGIVIKNNIGNEYVWIPCTVDGANGTLKYQRTKWGVETDNGTEAFKDELTLLNSDVTYSEADTSNGINADISKEIVSQIQAEKKSISTYGGYYIGRYETGVLNNTAVIQYNQTPYAEIKWSTAYNLVKGIEVGNRGTSYLCSSYAWDTAINFIQSNTTFKNYATTRTAEMNENWVDMEVKDSSGNKIKDAGTAQRLETGRTTAKANIYDMGGNVSEFTTELMPGTSETVVFRGGPYANVEPAGYRYDDGAGSSGGNSIYGFRATLFLK